MRKLLPLIGLIFTFQVSAQIGGSSAFTYTLIENSARHTALGGIAIAHQDADPAMGYQNPALINPMMHNTVSASYAKYMVSDINLGFVSYGMSLKDDTAGSMLFSIAYYDYGEFTRTDENGKIHGVFDASDYTFQVGYSKKWKDKFRYGVNGKFLYSVYYAYVSTAAAVDFGGSYFDPETKLYAGFTIKNIGYQILTYSNQGNHEPLPFDVQASISKKLLHNPLRFTLTLHDLHRWRNSYVNTNTRNKEIDLETGEIKNQKIGFGDQAMRHVIFNAELIFSDNFQLRFGYNHQRRAELSPEERRAVTGMSWGVGIGIKKFYISYSSASFFPGVSTNYFTVYRDLSGWGSANSKK